MGLAVDTATGPAHFKVELRAGSDETKAAGLAFDVVRATYRGADPQLWLERYDTPLTFNISVKSQILEEEAIMLCEEWTKRMQWFYDLFVVADKDFEFEYVPDAVDSYQESDAFKSWAEGVAGKKAVSTRLTQLRQARPAATALSHALVEARRAKRRRT